MTTDLTTAALTKQIIDHYDLRPDTPFWYAELALIADDPQAFVDVLPSQDTEAIWYVHARLKSLGEKMAQGLDLVGPELRGDLMALVRKCREACEGEVARRGRTLVSETAHG